MAHRPFVQDKSASHRPARFAQLVKEELSQMIPGELKDPRLAELGFLTITDVTITPDLKHATIMFALMGEEKKAKDIAEALNAAANFLRRNLMHKLQTKITPHLVFKYDKGFNNTMAVDSLFKQIEAQRKEQPAAAGSDASTDSSESDDDQER